VALSLLPYSLKAAPKKDLLNFQHPLQPVVKTKNLPNLSTNYYILIDNDTNQILLSQNANSRVYPASTTKLATVLTALNIYPLDEVVTVKAYNNGQNMSLQDGEKVTIRTLVSGLLIYSANDAAFNLANHYPQGPLAFVDQMNNLVKKYNIKNTHFVNYDGLHDNNHYSTPYDLAQIGRLASQNPTVRELVKTKEITLSDIYGQITHHLTTTDELLDLVPEIEGLKTGWTPEADGCFIGLLNINGHYLISVVAQSNDRFADTKMLVTWAKDNLNWNIYQ
jgi:D-alanyl-D-alanine carboxypeptidase (penicillin-binding protein 5/6)